MKLCGELCANARGVQRDKASGVGVPQAREHELRHGEMSTIALSTVSAALAGWSQKTDNGPHALLSSPLRREVSSER